jgi:hypothetical protein
MENEKKVYCKDCKFVIVNRTELFGEIKETKCGKVVGYKDTPFEKKPIQENMEALNEFNECVHYVHILDMFGKPLGEKEKDEAEAKVKAEERREHIRRYTLKEDWHELWHRG